MEEILDVFEIEEGQENIKSDSFRSSEHKKQTTTKKCKEIFIEKGRFDYPYNYDHEIDYRIRGTYFPVPYRQAVTPSFYGYCYYCDYARHSQNYCPLKLCYRCGEYGHTYKVCKKTSTQCSKLKTFQINPQKEDLETIQDVFQDPNHRPSHRSAHCPASCSWRSSQSYPTSWRKDYPFDSDSRVFHFDSFRKYRRPYFKQFHYQGQYY